MTSPGYLGTGITEAQQAAFDRDGYIILRGVLTEDEIRRLRLAGDRAEQRWLADPGRIGTDKPYLRRVEPLVEYDDEFVALLNHDAFFPIVREVLGSGITMLDTSYFITPPGQGWGDTSEWHIDEALTGPVGAPIPLMAKVSITLDEIGGPEDGPTALIPGSHLRSYDENLAPPADPRDMPGKLPLLVSPGDAVIFHGRVYHAAMPNTGSRTRRMLHYNYGHIWMKPWPDHEPSERVRALAADSDVRKQLLHVSNHHYLDRLPGTER
jgi:ectoine hydroxylase-related dioxygenase (phytanoyl-CoA dioxygenase family)